MRSNFNHIFTITLLLFTASVAASQTTGGIKGKIRGDGGEVLAGATVTARVDGADIKSIKANKKGEFVLDGLKPGKYNFVFEMSGYTPGLRYDVPVSAGSARDLGDRLILARDDSDVVFLRGSVFDRNGKSIQGARVEVHKISADGRKRLVASSYSNYSGEFAFRQTDSDAVYSITASLSGKSSSRELKVDSTGIHRVSITLDMER
jgi:hypothetical protein